ncbi:neuraminidase-like domain-containing protein [Morganella morganii]|uniref:Tc toxin subunit A-related protein n=1 Tax=Morganella morganii TaxID=582 RepID=UPI0031B61954
MQTLAAILKKVSNEGDNTAQTLCDLMPLSYAEIYEKYHDIISDDEARILFQQAQIQNKKNRFTDAEIVAHSNPQIKNIPHLYTGQSPELRYGNDFIPDRISEYAEPGMVSSMFSPAAYLTELYREARELHKQESKYHLDKRRPDLKALSLSQENLNDEISTLELSNDVLFTALKGTGDEQSVLQRLSEKCQSIALPYHEPFQIIKKVSELKKIFPIVNKYPSIINNKKTDKTWIKTIDCGFSPALLAMLKEIYTNIKSAKGDKLDKLIKKYITDDLSYLYSLKNVMNYFDLTSKKFSILTEFFEIKDDPNQENTEEYKKNILKLRGVVSLYKATELPLETIIFILKSFKCDLADKKAINAIINLKIVRDNCQLRDEDIAVLLGGNIVESKVNTDISQFDRIFNRPPLGGKKLTADNTELDLSKVDYNDDDHKKFIINCLKRALGINESLLAEFSKFIYGEEQNFICNIESLSLFYRAILIARMNNITVNTLIMLFRLLPDVFKSNIHSCGTADDIYDLLYDINYYITWFNENELSISMCYLLLRKGDEVVVSQGVSDIISEIRNGLNKEDVKDKSLKSDELIIKLSPALSSVLDISSVSTVESALRWVNILKPEGIDIRTLFLNICDKGKTPGEKENKTVIFIIKMSVMINMIAIDDSLLSLWIKKPACLDVSLDIREYKFSIIKMMIDANAVIKRTGEKSDLVISSLNNDGLSYKIIADIFGQDNKIVQQAFKFFGEIEIIRNYRLLTDVIMVLDLFKETDVSPDDFTKLFCGDKKDKVYNDYLNISKVAELTLEPDEVIELKGTVNKRRSSALCSLYIIEKLRGLSHENDNAVVYRKLLIDTEISEEIKTTRIAEAISGIQLYVNNCLNNTEKEVQGSVRTRMFFRNWEEYNRRYSTWAALSMLVYYPENYIDPVIRTGKTAMMDHLQQLISQEGIKKEAIDDAFRTYLTEFDQVADLNVISAYHDEFDMRKGQTFFIGNSYLNSDFYYWRSLNNEMITEKDGGFIIPASSWTAWKKIECSTSPCGNMLRIVTFNGRMYLVWLEYSESKNNKADDKEVNVKISINFSYLRYDGLWSVQNSVDLSKYHSKLTEVGININSVVTTGFYCSSYIESDEILVMLYNKEKEKNGKFVFTVKGDFSLDIKSEDAADSVYKELKEYLEIENKKPVINDISKRKVSFLRDESKDKYDKYEGAYSLDSGFIKNTNMEFDSVKDEYKTTLTFDLCFDIDRGVSGPGRYYKSWSKLCFDYSWYDHDVDYYILFLRNKFSYMGHSIDSIVFLFDITNDAFTLFFYNFKNDAILNLGTDFFDKILLVTHKPEGGDVSINVTKMQEGPYKLKDEVGVYYLLQAGGRDLVGFNLQVDDSHYSESDEGRVFTFWRNAPVLNKFLLAISSSSDDGEVYEEKEWSAPREIINNKQVVFKSKGNGIDFKVRGDDIYKYNGRNIDVVFKAYHQRGLLFLKKYVYVINVFDVNKNLMTLNYHHSGAQYLQFSDSKKTVVRLNTLFSKKMILKANKGVDYVLTLDNQQLVEPDITVENSGKLVLMDFNGANAIYFWELFYYAPMMIADILFQHQSYNEAERWLQYVFNPAGYIENDIYTERYWNVRPLVEDTQWNENESLPDDTDPDAIALADPMHYKMATFMKTLELIIARGDKAYRELERDSLNEAKSWYIQALSLLGKEPVTLLNKNWSSPDLAGAAKATMQRLLMQVNNPDHPSAISVNSANTLTKVFKPQLNDKLISLRETINQRLFNLRNGLSINGQRLYLPIFSSPEDPRNILESQVNTINSEKDIKKKVMLMYRFPAVIENAKSLVSQLIEFGGKLLDFNESRDNEQFSELLIHQGNDLLTQSIRIQDAEIKNLQAEKISLLSQQREIIHRAEHYEALHSEYILPEEAGAIVLNTLAVGLSGQSRVIKGLGMLADLAPNIFGVAAGGSDWSAGTDCASELMGGAAETMQGLAYPLEKGAEYRRRAQEWQLESESAREEEKQIAAELEAMDIQITAAKMQRHYIVTEQRQNQQQLQFLQRKFTRAELYGWLRGRLMAIYSPFYDLAVSRCFMAEDAYRYEMNVNAADRSFINTSAWKGAYSGLMAGESLMLNLAQLEEAYLEKDKRVLEVTRTVSLAEVYSSGKMGADKFSFADVTALVSAGIAAKKGNDKNYVQLKTTTEQTNRMELDAVIKLDELGIYTDYPKNLGVHRLIMQISVTLPALIEPYQNVRALLEYEGEGDNQLPVGCKSIAVSHGMNDSGLFHLQFGDSTYLPFEGLSVNSNGKFKLRFFDVGGGDQKRLLQTLTDIVLHIRYTIY